MTLVFCGGAFLALILLAVFGFGGHGGPPRETKAEGMARYLRAEVKRHLSLADASHGEAYRAASAGGPVPTAAFRLLGISSAATARQVDIAAADIVWQNDCPLMPVDTIDYDNMIEFIDRVWAARREVYAWRGWAPGAGWDGRP